MSSRDHVSRRRCLVVWAAATLVAASLAGWLLPHLGAAIADPPSTGRFEEWLVVGCEAAALGTTAWLWVLVSLVSLEAAGGPVRQERHVPPAVRRLVLAACGAGLVAGVTAPTYAVPPPSPLTGLPLPDRPAGHALPSQPGPAHPATASDRHSRPRGPEPGRTVRVAGGDSLWALAAADLPAAASAAEIDEHWREIHAANRGVIGDDPDLILPGQQLRLPPSTPGPPPTA